MQITDGNMGMVIKTVERRTRESVMSSLPPPGQLPQQSSKHLDLLYALAYPKREGKELSRVSPKHDTRPMLVDKVVDELEVKEEEAVAAAAEDEETEPAVAQAY